MPLARLYSPIFPAKAERSSHLSPNKRIPQKNAIFSVMNSLAVLDDGFAQGFEADTYLPLCRRPFKVDSDSLLHLHHR